MGNVSGNSKGFFLFPFAFMGNVSTEIMEYPCTRPAVHSRPLYLPQEQSAVRTLVARLPWGARGVSLLHYTV